MRLRWMFNFAEADKHVSSGLAVIKFLTSVACWITFIGVGFGGFFGNGKSKEASSLPYLRR